jgi:hypothetical protein
MIEDTETYYRRRSNEELAAAQHAADPAAANIHRSLAARYSALAGQPQVRRVEDQPIDEPLARSASGGR